MGRPPSEIDLLRILQGGPQLLGPRLALGMALSPRSGSPLAQRYPPLLERRTMGRPPAAPGKSKVP